MRATIEVYPFLAKVFLTDGVPHSKFVGIPLVFFNIIFGYEWEIFNVVLLFSASNNVT